MANAFQCGAFQQSAFQMECDVVVQPEVDFGVGPSRPFIAVRNAKARGRLLVVLVDLIDGDAAGRAKTLSHTLIRYLDLFDGQGSGSAMAFPSVSITEFQIEGGKAKGFDAVRHDNEFILLGD